MSFRKMFAVILAFNAGMVGLAYLLSHWPVQTVCFGAAGSVCALVAVAAHLKRTNHPALNHPDDIGDKN